MLLKGDSNQDVRCLPSPPPCAQVLLGTGKAAQPSGVWEVYTAYCDCCWLLEVPLRWQQGQEVFVGWKWSKISIDLQLSVILSAGRLLAQMFKLHKTTQPSHLWIYWSDEEALSSVVTQAFPLFFKAGPFTQMPRSQGMHSKPDGHIRRTLNLSRAAQHVVLVSTSSGVINIQQVITQLCQSEALVSSFSVLSLGTVAPFSRYLGYLMEKLTHFFCESLIKLGDIGDDHSAMVLVVQESKLVIS